MKLLMIYTTRIAWRPGDKTLPEEPECLEGGEMADVLVGLIHAEAIDEAQEKAAETKLIKNLKWAARKNDTIAILLHSFAHLAETKASPGFVKGLLDRAETRLRQAGYEAVQTPFGYFLDLDLSAPGRSSARIFASF